MYRQCLSVVAGLLAAAAFALSPGTATAQHHGGGHSGGGHSGGGHSGGGWHGGGGGWHGGGHNGWGGWGVAIGLGYPYGGWGWGGYGGYYGYGYSPYYYDSYPYYADTGDYYYSTPAYGDMTAPNYSYGAASQPAADNEARLRVIVPPNARVWFDDKATSQTGPVRFFESPVLTPGRDYTYDVKAQWRDENGKDVTQTRHVDVRANSRVNVDFTRPMAQEAGATSR
jgi:uncharacterized protein (TIGR03000 family)